MVRRILAAVILALPITVSVALAPPAAAHADLILATPDDGARLSTVPTQVELTFSEDLLPETVVVSVEDSAGMVIRVLEFEVDGSDVIVAWPPGLSGTDYTVNYRVVSQDGHPVSGSLAFTVDTPPVAVQGSASPASAAASAAPVIDAVPASDTGSVVPIAAVAAGLGVGIAIGFLYLVTRRRGRSGAPVDPGSDSAS
jgi:methionine-rich copper-binding protein CopC